MTFVRRDANNWHREVPGARWFKADVHIHTIDDHAGGRATLPNGISGSLESSETIAAYARRFLQSAVKRGVQVLGLTPHSPRIGNSAESSAVWRIVNEWNAGTDEDGVPFREKIYAVFPGFEPNVNDGGSGVHLLFLFDPEIGARSLPPLVRCNHGWPVPLGWWPSTIDSAQSNGNFSNHRSAPRDS